MERIAFDSQIVKAVSSLTRAQRCFEERLSMYGVYKAVPFGYKLSCRSVHCNSDYSISLFWHDKLVEESSKRYINGCLEHIIVIRGSILITDENEKTIAQIDAPNCFQISEKHTPYKVKSLKPKTKGCVISVLRISEH